jgi:hypothetical protein
MNTEKHLQKSHKGGFVPEVTTEEFSVVPQEDNGQAHCVLEMSSVIRNFRITATNGKLDLPKPVFIEGKDGDGS